MYFDEYRIRCCCTRAVFELIGCVLAYDHDVQPAAAWLRAEHTSEPLGELALRWQNFKFFGLTGEKFSWRMPPRTDRYKSPLRQAHTLLASRM